MRSIPSVPDSLILADSQFDLDQKSNGWLFLARDEAGNYEAMRAVRPGPDEILADVVMICSDEYALVQRDSLHPGHSRSPCLAYDAPRDLGVCLFVQASIIRPQCEDPIAVMVSINHREVARAEMSYGEIATFSGAVALKHADRLVIQFSKIEDIRNLKVLHYAILWKSLDNPAGYAEAGQGIGVTVSSTLSGFDEGLTERLTQAGISPDGIRRLARNPFSTITGGEWSAAVAASIGRASHRTDTPALGEARFFDPRRATKDRPS